MNLGTLLDLFRQHKNYTANTIYTFNARLIPWLPGLRYNRFRDSRRGVRGTIDLSII